MTIYFTHSTKTHHLSTGDVAQVDDDVDIGRPALELHLPGGDGGERHDDEEGSVQRVLVHQVVKEGDRLHSFTQTHLISQNTAVVPKIRIHTQLQMHRIIVHTTKLESLLNVQSRADYSESVLVFVDHYKCLRL